MPRWPERTIEERFWEKVDKTEDCWIWTASKKRKGHGQFLISKGNLVLAHVFAYQLLVGPVPDGLMLDHIRCVPYCVRPDHLRPVTNKQNGENRRGAHPINQTGIRGVSWHPQKGRYRARVMHHGKGYHVGYFDTVEEAEEAVIARRNELFTHNEKDRG